MDETGRIRARSLLALVAGFGIWSVAFVALYAGLSIGCALGWNAVEIGPISLLRLLLISGFIVTLLALALIARRLWRRARMGDQTGTALVPQVSAWLAVAALVAGVFTYAPVVFLTACGA